MSQSAPHPRPLAALLTALALAGCGTGGIAGPDAATVADAALPADATSPDASPDAEPPVNDAAAHLDAAAAPPDAIAPDAGPPPVRADLFAAVDPFIGTGGLGFGVGSSYPGPAVPFGMIHPSPDTRDEFGNAVNFYHCSGYYTDDRIIAAFGLLHFHGTGVPDYGTMGVMPTLGMTDDKRPMRGHMIGFDKETEAAAPGYYRVSLLDGIDVEVTASSRAATFRFTFPADTPPGERPTVLFDLAHLIEGEIREADARIDPAASSVDAHIQHFGPMSGGAGGYHLYARGVFDTPPAESGTWDAAGLRPGQNEVTDTAGGAYFTFPAGTESVTLRVAVSFVDAAGAAANLEAEAPTFDFDAMRTAAETAWRAELDTLELYGLSAYETEIMGTALYHALLMPTQMTDVDHRFIDVSGTVQTDAPPFNDRFNDFSLWDTYRTLHPYLILAEHPRNADFVSSLVDMAREGGAVPVWGIAHGDSHTMIGSPGEIVLAESALKGVPLENELEAYQLSRVAAFGPSPGPIGGRDGNLSEYIEKGYVPYDVSNGSVSLTQEYASADAALGHWAARLGLMEDADLLTARGQSYRNVFYSPAAFFFPRYAEGVFRDDVVPERNHNAYVEGNAWQYLWMVPHDPDGLAELFGGREPALAKLREFFALSEHEVPVIGMRKYYWHNNEPDINAPWLFAAWGAVGEGNRWIDWAVNTLHTDGPDGLPGNDDGGTMSAWLLFAELGLYPITGSDEYILAMPRAPRIVMRRASGDLVITARPAPAVGLEPARITLDGVPVEGGRIKHGQLVGDHTLAFELRPMAPTAAE